MPNARAPYNFVPLAEGNPIPGQRVHHDRYYLDRHTGYFDVTLETVTPLFVRGMITEQEIRDGREAKDQPCPFMVDGKPVIPGSTLRGMIRNLVEIITFGKIHFVSDNKLVYRAMYYADALATTYRGITTDVLGNKQYMYPSSRMNGGYLQKGNSESGWVIQPATVHYGESIALVDRQDVLAAGIPESPKLTVHQVGVKPATKRVVHVGKQGVQLHIAKANGISLISGKGYERATLIISNTVGKIGGKESNRRWYPAIYEADPTAKPIPIPQRIWDDFTKDRDLNRGIANRKLQNPGDALFYLLDSRGELTFFGPTMFFRIPYENSVGSLIYDNPLDPNFTDYADAMFGYISERGSKEKRDPVAYAGRISVASAYVTGDSHDYFDEAIIPKILSTPKPTTFQHYLNQPDVDRNAPPDTQKSKLRHYGANNVKISGHKLYWRQKIDDLTTLQDPEYRDQPQTRETLEKKKDTQHTVMQPIRSGVLFSFRVYFENLTDAELGALAWALTLEGDENLNHMIGMGKPYGLGVVKLMPSLVITDRDARYRTLFGDSGAWYTATGGRAADTYIQAFKQTLNIDFDNHDRINQLKAMLRLYTPDPELFSYMQIEGPNGNEYKDRPVLPYPTEVEAVYKAEEAKRRKAAKELIGFEVGDEIVGDVFDNSNGIEFTPRKQYGDKEYEGYIPADKVVKQRNPDTRVDARILEIIDGDPGTLICEQIIPDKKK